MPGRDDRDAHQLTTAAAAMDMEGATTMCEPLVKVSNHHTASCGEPPAVDGDAVSWS